MTYFILLIENNTLFFHVIVIIENFNLFVLYFKVYFQIQTAWKRSMKSSQLEGFKPQIRLKHCPLTINLKQILGSTNSDKARGGRRTEMCTEQGFLANVTNIFGQGVEQIKEFYNYCNIQHYIVFVHQSCDTEVSYLLLNFHLHKFYVKHSIPILYTILFEIYYKKQLKYPP